MLLLFHIGKLRPACRDLPLQILRCPMYPAQQLFSGAELILLILLGDSGAGDFLAGSISFGFECLRLLHTLCKLCLQLCMTGFRLCRLLQDRGDHTVHIGKIALDGIQLVLTFGSCLLDIAKALLPCRDFCL